MKLRVRKSTKRVVPVNDIVGKELLKNFKKGVVSVEDIRDKAKVIQSRCFDEKIKVSDLSFRGMVDSSNTQMFSLDTGNEEAKSILTPYSLAQLGTRYGIPSRYVNKCVSVGKSHSGFIPLVEENYKRWMNIDHNEVVLRQYDNVTSDGTIAVTRGIVTPKYKIFDTSEIMEVIAQNFDTRKNYSVRQYLMNPERFHIRLISDEQLDVPEEDLYMGITIDSSDVGRSSLCVRGIIFKQVCSNGLILPKSIGDMYRQIHVGIGADRFYEDLVACVAALSDMKVHAENIINSAIDSKVIPFDINDEDDVEKFRKKYVGLSKETMNDIIELMNNEVYGDADSRWGLVNSITEVAQKYSLETRINLEKTAGLLLVA